jgi:hypothetical protein
MRAADEALEVCVGERGAPLQRRPDVVIVVPPVPHTREVDAASTLSCKGNEQKDIREWGTGRVGK